MSRTFLVTFLVLLGASWGGTIPLTKIAVSSGHHPLGIIFWQLLVSAVLLAPFVWWRGLRLSKTRPHLKLYLVIALIGTLIPNSFSYWSAFHLPGGVMALTIAAVPVFATILASLMGTDRLNPKKVLGVILGMLAISLLIVPDTSLPDPAKAIFVLVALIAPFAYAVEANYLVMADVPESPAIVTLLGASIIGCILALPFSIALGGFVNPFETFEAPEMALFAASLIHVSVYVGYIWLVAQAGPVFASQMAYLVTASGVLLSAFALGELHSIWLWFALALLMGAIFLVQPRNDAEQVSP